VSTFNLHCELTGRCHTIKAMSVAEKPDSRIRMREFIGICLKIACRHSWERSQTVTTIILMLIGFITWKWPSVISSLFGGRVVTIPESTLLFFVLVAIILIRLGLSPYWAFQDLKKERDEFKLDLDELREIIRQRGKSKTETLLSKAVDMMRESQKSRIADLFIEPIGALVSVADELRTEEEVVELCEALRKHTGSDPFTGLILRYQTSFEGRRLSFIKEARYNSQTKQIRNDDDAINFAYTFWSGASTLPDIFS
jgi:hypothetical protein